MSSRKSPPPAAGPDWTHPWVDPSGRVWVADVEWGTINGRAEPVSVTIRSGNGHPVTAAAVRAFPLAGMIAFARRASAAVLTGRRRDQFNARRGVAMSPESLEVVAEVYRAAYQRGDPVTKAVAGAFGIAPSTAGKRIMAARRAGLLEGLGDMR
jgi:hypothetical protein